MARQGVLLLLVAVGCLCLAPGLTPASDLTGWGFALENGDTNGDQIRDLSDGVYLLSNLFLGGPAPVPLAYCGAKEPGVTNGDSNGDGRLDVSDPVQLFGWLYSGSPAPVEACGAEGGGAKTAMAYGVARVAPPHSMAFGKSLAEWMEIYWRWSYGGGSDTVGRVRLLAIPAGELQSGDGTPDSPAYLKGEIDIVLPPGTPFVLPQFAWIAETYQPSDPPTPDDPCIEDAFLLAGVTPLKLTIDGFTVVSDENESKFYTPCTPFDPPIMYDAPTDYGSIGAIAYQGVGFVSPPLPVGNHVIQLYEEYIIRDYMGFSFGVIYDNTWNIQVKPKPKP